MEKSPEAFRTISEVAEFLDTPAHVLRFWESRFPQIRPVKRAGGRRYYRPGDVALLSGIKRLLHDEGMTIRGVQKILREQGIRHVAGLTEPETPEADVEAILAAEFAQRDEPALPPVEAQTAQIISLEAALVRAEAARAEPVQPDLWPQDPADHGAQDGAGASVTAWRKDAAEGAAEDAAEGAAEGADVGADDAAEAPFIDADADQDAAATIPLEPVQNLRDPNPAPVPPAVMADDEVADRTSTARDDTAADPVADTSADTSTDTAPDASPESAAASPTIAARLRQVHPSQMADHQVELRAIRSRMIALRDRLAEGARRRAK